MTYRRPDDAPVLAKFRDAMAHQLAENAHKGDWRRLDEKALLHELEHHVLKLKKAIKAKDRGLIQEHAADVGNAAMFVAATLSTLDPPYYSGCRHYGCDGRCCGSY